MLRNSFHLIGLLSTFMAGTQANLMRLSSKDCVLGPYCTFIRANTPLKEMQNATKKVSSFRIAPLPEQYRIPLNSTPVMLQWREKSVVKQNNCYNFATKMISNTFARPGRPIPHHFPQEKLDQCSHIVEAIQSDGFPQVSKEEVGDYSGDKVRCSYFASVITAADAPLYGRDFHFYRLMNHLDGAPGDNQTWWHKPGKTDVIITDFSGNPIYDVEKANHGEYEQFCGYFRKCEGIV